MLIEDKNKRFNDVFANFVVNCLHKKNHQFSELFIHVSLTIIWFRAQTNQKGLDNAFSTVLVMKAVQNETLKN